MSESPMGFPLTKSHREKIFPKLTPAKIDSIVLYGCMRSVQSGEVLLDQGDKILLYQWDIKYKIQKTVYNQAWYQVYTKIQSGHESSFSCSYPLSDYVTMALCSFVHNVSNPLRGDRSKFRIISFSTLVINGSVISSCLLVL